MDKRSFTLVEKKLRREYRTKLNAAESTEDVRKFFGQTVLKLFDRVFDGALSIEYEDIVLGADGEQGFSLKGRAMKKAGLREVWEGSDLSDIIRRFAEAAGKRMKHLEKNPAKTESKIYHDRD